MIYIENLLIYILFLPLIGTVFLIVTPSNQQGLLKFIALNFSCLTFICSLLLWIIFNKSIGIFQFVTKILWINTIKFKSNFRN